uniref:Uncharacterized protein n=1 Tax=Sphaerodactylus townsendi TaxID=933632 RepID=A0ACB8EKH8_9SAUR
MGWCKSRNEPKWALNNKLEDHKKLCHALDALQNYNLQKITFVNPSQAKHASNTAKKTQNSSEQALNELQGHNKQWHALDTLYNLEQQQQKTTEPACLSYPFPVGPKCLWSKKMTQNGH